MVVKKYNTQFYLRTEDSGEAMKIQNDCGAFIYV